MGYRRSLLVCLGRRLGLCWLLERLCPHAHVPRLDRLRPASLCPVYDEEQKVTMALTRRRIAVVVDMTSTWLGAREQVGWVLCGLVSAIN